MEIIENQCYNALMECIKSIKDNLLNLISSLRDHGDIAIAQQLEKLISPEACWTTGSEFLNELDEQLRMAIQTNADWLDGSILSAMTKMSECISTWRVEAHRDAIPYVPQPQQPLPPPQTLKQWLRSREEE